MPIFMPIGINGNIFFTENWYSETAQKFTVLIVKMRIFQIKILNQINF